MVVYFGPLGWRNNFYQSAHNGSQNPAVDTVAVGDTVVWKWSSSGSHQIRSTGVGGTIFRNSVVLSTASASYAVTFKNPGTYPYDCGVHGSAMTGVIVVQ
ncbi:MAG TPA: plastocyanin/azurin family copper-binding protein [Gemmatimonadales bacterium]|nr:plastocyanin/azurin family copper-binding protein [Gemmatimonadales bacterium]